MEKLAVLIATVSLAGTAYAGSFFSESEANNTLATANDLGSYNAANESVLVSGSLGASDVDWFSFTLDVDADLAFFSAFGTGDGIMQIVAAGGDVIAFSDDEGAGAMPALQIENLAAGTYYVGFSGFSDVFSVSVGSDELADGLDAAGAGHGEEFAYKLSVGFSIPAPGALALFGMGGIVATRRRR